MDTFMMNCLHDTTSPRLNVSIHLVDLSNPETNAAYVIKWSKDGIELPELANKTSFIFDDWDEWYDVHVQFVTDEVKTDPHGYLEGEAGFRVFPCENNFERMTVDSKIRYRSA